MISDEALRTLVGIIGNIICLFFFLSPVPTFVRIWKKGAVEDYSAMPYLATLFSCMIWTLYGLPVVHPGSILVLTISFLGVVIEIILLIIFLIFSDKKKRLKLLLLIFLELFVVALLATLSLTLFHTYKKRSLIVGVVGIFSSIIMYSSPLSIMVPNGLGIVFGVAQLILYGVYYKSTKKIMKEKKGKEVILSDVIVVSSVNNNQPNKTTSTTTLAPPHNDSNKDQFSIV
ncbi:bidirectional sugar transporter SWEET4 isoform X2 [Cannabis sativa]|uniref:bidirectional sugar transporter SWEET4 isoform X2 n=1 Tax=Cannabis sativa TaxID=3483 RepID=UPI0029CA3AD3|nr:bidirectional sugar transporter SWEET4 isoform X2 [Cannabis sativa]